MNFSQLPPPFNRQTEKPPRFTSDGRRINNGFWFAAVMFALLVGCTAWLSSG